MEELKEEIILIRGRKRTTTLAIIVNSGCSGLDVCVQTRFTGCRPTAQDGALKGVVLLRRDQVRTVEPP